MVEEIDAILDKSGKTVCGTLMSPLDCSRRWFPIPVFCMSLLINHLFQITSSLEVSCAWTVFRLTQFPTPCSLLPTPWAGARTGIGKRWFTGLHNSEGMWLTLVLLFCFRNYSLCRNPGSYWCLCEALWNARPYSLIYGESAYSYSSFFGGEDIYSFTVSSTLFKVAMKLK